MAVRFRQVTLTPKMAKELLNANERNRNLDRRRVDEYAAAILRGEWELNGETVKVDRNGAFIDGQTRAAAVVKADKSIPIFLVEGLDPETQKTIDTGARRTLANQLQIEGRANASNLAYAVTLAHRFDNNQPTNHGLRPSPQQADQILAEHPMLERAVGRVWHVRDIGLSPGVAGWLYTHFSEIDTEAAEMFWRKVMSGAELTADDPILKLREWYVRERAKPVPYRSSKEARIAIVIKAWNLWRDGRKIERLYWGANEPFPTAK